MYALVSLHDANYKRLGDLTWDQNRLLYAQQRGYLPVLQTENFDNTIAIGFEKIKLMKQVLEENPEVEWAWWTGTDTLVTNFAIGIEDKIDNDYHFIVATDCNGMNVDSFLIRNTPEGREYINYIWNIRDQYANHIWFEQQAMIESLEQFASITKIVPQRYLNAYNYQLYPGCDPHDLLGNEGDWQPGDWLIHWPGTGLDQRIQLAHHYMAQVIK
jgi:hypothetical protein